MKKTQFILKVTLIVLGVILFLSSCNVSAQEINHYPEISISATYDEVLEAIRFQSEGFQTGEMVMVSIFDTQGKELVDKNIIFGNPLSIADFASGTYIVTVSKDRRFGTLRFSL